MMRRTHAHKTAQQRKRRHWHHAWIRATGITASDRHVISRIKGHVGHLWWVTGQREIGRAL
jgi:hypothetical protein